MAARFSSACVVAVVIVMHTMISGITASSKPTDPMFTNGVQQVWQGDTILFEKLFGHKNREDGIAISIDDQFRIGSNSKTFTTMAILQLSERTPQLFGIHDNISDYLSASDLEGWGYEGSVYCPKFNGTNDPCQELTFYDLMIMRSGLVNALGCFQYPAGSWQTQYCVDEAMFQYYRGSVSDTMKWFSNVPLESTPGTEYNYNNGNTIVLSFFVEKFSGLILEEYMRRYLFEPMGLFSTSQNNLAQQLQSNNKQVQNYYDYTDVNSGSYEYFAYGNAASTLVNQGVQTGAGGFMSTAHDMVKFYTSLFVTKNVSHVISDAALALMIEPINPVRYHPDFGCDIFGAGIFMSYQSCTNLDVLTNRRYIYYQGAIDAATATILVLDDWNNPSAKRIVSTSLRNNAIVITNESSWRSAKSDSGNKSSIFQKYSMVAVGDSWWISWQNAMYFQANPTPYPIPEDPILCPTTNNDEDSISIGVYVGSMFSAAAFVIIAMIIYLQFIFLPQISGGNSSSTSAMAFKSEL